MRALIRLLSHLTNRDVVDFGRDQSGSDAQVDIAKVLHPFLHAPPVMFPHIMCAYSLDRKIYSCQLPILRAAVLQIVFLGLDLVIPLVTGELLQFPKLVRSFFSLLSYMMEIYPEHVASLPGALPLPMVFA